MDYSDFIATKAFRAPRAGFESEDIHPMLFDFQKAITQWAIRKGRAAIFADTGLGKTLMQLEWARNVASHEHGRIIIIAPLCVGYQTKAEAENIGIVVGDVGSDASIHITNYEQSHKIDPGQYCGVVLDESSILKSIDGKTQNMLRDKFDRTQFKLCCTATPAPNDRVELGNHSAFLGIMTQPEMLATFFVNRGGGNRDWDLKRHAHEDFLKWLASWAMFVRKPSDIGFSDDRHILPELNIHAHVVESELSAPPGKLFPTGLLGVSDRARVRKKTISERVNKAVDILYLSNNQAIAWCGLNAEQDMIARKLSSDCVSISGKDSAEEKMAKTRSFLSGEVRFLVTKPKIFGFGMNLQCASEQVFVGINDSYEQYYQSIRRSWRYGQKRPVNVHVVVTDLETEIVENVHRKEQDALALHNQMVEEILQYENDELQGVDDEHHAAISKVEEDDWTMYNGDCVDVMTTLPDDSIDFSIFSPPFASLYTYSNSTRDMGNCRGENQFFEQFSYAIAELLRVMKPGRIVACHCQQLATLKSRDGFIGVIDFRGHLIDAFVRGGFVYHGEVCIDRNPQSQAIRTKTKGLTFAQLEKDASWMRPAFADYIILLRAPGDNDTPVKPECDRDEWITWAHPVWYDIRESHTLSTVEARGDNDEKHICPLQLDTIERGIRLWSNRGETVLSPFAGIGSEGYEAVKLERRFVGIELKEQYFSVACDNLRAASRAGRRSMFSKEA